MACVVEALEFEGNDASSSPGISKFLDDVLHILQPPNSTFKMQIQSEHGLFEKDGLACCFHIMISNKLDFENFKKKCVEETFEGRDDILANLDLANLEANNPIFNSTLKGLIVVFGDATIGMRIPMFLDDTGLQLTIENKDTNAIVNSSSYG